MERRVGMRRVLAVGCSQLSVSNCEMRNEQEIATFIKRDITWEY